MNNKKVIFLTIFFIIAAIIFVFLLKKNPKAKTESEPTVPTQAESQELKALNQQLNKLFELKKQIENN